MAGGKAKVSFRIPDLGAVALPRKHPSRCKEPAQPAPLLLCGLLSRRKSSQRGRRRGTKVTPALTRISPGVGW